jgi:hypothetical protein
MSELVNGENNMSVMGRMRSFTCSTDVGRKKQMQNLSMKTLWKETNLETRHRK